MDAEDFADVLRHGIRLDEQPRPNREQHGEGRARPPAVAGSYRNPPSSRKRCLRKRARSALRSS
jgi:hypothetical protein